VAFVAEGTGQSGFLVPVLLADQLRASNSDALAVTEGDHVIGVVTRRDLNSLEVLLDRLDNESTGRRAAADRSIPLAYVGEYFHGDTGAGLGASHQTGWTCLVADLITRRGR
jgi:hypothetical protein